MDNKSFDNQMDLVVDFSLGLLSADQEKVLLAAARANPELEAMLQRQCEDFERLRGSRIPRKISADSRVFPIVPQAKSRYRQPQTWLWSTAVAASLALVVWFSGAGGREQYWLPADNVLLVQRSGDKATEALNEGIKLYAEGDLSEAIVALQESEVQGTMADVRDIYLASALINSSRATEAHKIINTMDLDALPAPWRSYGYELLRLSASP